MSPLVLLASSCSALALVFVAVMLMRSQQLLSDIPGAPDRPTAAGLRTVSTGSDHVLKANDIEITFATRLAGGVWTLKWRGHDFVGVTEGNGGSMQSAVSYDVQLGHSNEEENPTEAGTINDRGGATSSKWLEAAKSDTEMFTRTHMAYFIPPGVVPPMSTAGHRARGRGLLSDTWMSKRVTIGWRRPNVVHYHVYFHSSAPHWFVQAEVLTGYMPPEFNQFFVVRSGLANRVKGPVYTTHPPQQAHPIIVAKSKDVAIGVWARSAPRGTFDATAQPWYSIDAANHNGHEPITLRPVRFTKWNVVWHGGSRHPPHRRFPVTHAFQVALVFGSVEECASTIATLT
jgi:hypothetical protein